MQGILKARKSFEHANAVGNQTQLYYTKHWNTLEACLPKDSIRQKSCPWVQNASSVPNIHATPAQRHVSSHFISAEINWKIKRLSNMNSVISNDNKILVWGSATFSLSWKHEVMPPLSSCQRQDNVPLQELASERERETAFSEQKRNEKGTFLLTVRTVLQVSETAAQARDFSSLQLQCYSGMERIAQQ